MALSLADERSGAMRSFEYGTYRAFAAQQQVFEALCGYSGGGLFTLEARGASLDAGIAAITPELFDVLRVGPLLGRLIEPQDAPGTGEPAPVVVIGHSLWQRLFNGDPDAVGERLVVDGLPLTIVGILPPTFHGLHVDGGDDFYLPIAFVGLYALLAHAVVRRTQEIGLRLAIGASRFHVVTMVLRDGLWLTLFGILLWVPCVLAAGHLVIALLYEVRLTDPATLAATSVIALLVGGLACLLPARRAARIEPMEALRYE